jgi:hypothetical protein
VDQKILCISGRKQAGKDTCYKFLHGLVTRDSTFPAMSREIGQFYFAEPLKRMCVDILGCPEELVYGTDQQKNTAVPHLLWENFPVPVLLEGTIVRVHIAGNEYYEGSGTHSVMTEPHVVPCRLRTGPMTVREVLQYWGSEIFRRQYRDVWADACIRAIRKSGVPLAVITDCRFPNEVSAAKEAGGRVVRLNRVVFPEDSHASETALDPDRYDWGNFDVVIYNACMTVERQCILLYQILHDHWGWLPDAVPDVVREQARRVAA